MVLAGRPVLGLWMECLEVNFEMSVAEQNGYIMVYEIRESDEEVFNCRFK